MQAQLAALQRGDAAGVFCFASPRNQQVTGPLERFEAMLQARWAGDGVNRGVNRVRYMSEAE